MFHCEVFGHLPVKILPSHILCSMDDAIGSIVLTNTTIRILPINSIPNFVKENRQTARVTS
uniref:Uncharacterized protein n=1 Tax=Candidatus Methanogaster sp. ANME-2c ERB4 TaxID=2759911 RepID=A0A7G9YN37_9EURY|nr:hypothetical protein JHKIABMC_00027 [Methanosarcinales archaeon ANME-2c ERB4]